MTTISELAEQHGFKGTAYHRYSEIGTGKQFTIDETVSGENSITTRIDCYISGSYIGNDGKSLEIKQRYTIYIAYSASTQRMAMERVRSIIMQDFESNFPQFSVQDVFIPEEKFITPLGKEGRVESEEFYYGTDLFKRLARRDIAQYKLRTERDIYRSRTTQIRKKYGI